ncbi:MAG: glycosyltransferase [Ignavibacteriales bacterium]|nr:glycosyltransferase [Ignavibacteriales bacterium]
MSKKIEKKIVIIGPAYPYRGGNSLFVSSLYEVLQEKFEVKIYNFKLLYPGLLFPGKTQFDDSKTLVKKTPSERLVNSISPFNWISVANKLKKENADLIIFDWWHPFFSFCYFSISALIRKKYKGKILFITENVISHEGHFVDKLLTKLGLRNADKFLALSEEVVTKLSDLSFNKKVYRSELPVYDWYKVEDKIQNVSLRKELGFNDQDKILLFFGYVRKYKGLDILIEALKPLIEYDPKIKLLVVGEFYDDYSFYERKIKELNLHDFVKVINKYVPNEEVNKYFEISDLVVLPYRSATQSGILNIAYGALKPVVVTKVGGLAESIEDNKTGIIVEAATPVDIYKGIKKYFQLKSSVDFSLNIKEKIRGNSFNKMPELISQIISETEK